MPGRSVTSTGVALRFRAQVVAKKIVDVFPQLDRFSSTAFLQYGDLITNKDYFSKTTKIELLSSSPFSSPLNPSA
jgi:hypothetical protein